MSGQDLEKGKNEGKFNKSKKYKRRRRLILVLVTFLLCVGALTAGGYYSYKYVMSNYTHPGDEEEVVIKEEDAVEFVVPKGVNTLELAELLNEGGFIKNIKLFQLLSKLNGYDGRYQSGTHIIATSLTYDEYMRVLTSGATTVSVTIPEGKSFLQIVDILFSKGLIESKDAFIKTANTGSFDYDFLSGLSERDYRLEGYLFPDTYKFDVNVSDETIINTMLANFKKKMKDAYLERIKQIDGMSLDKIITLASIIEREAKTTGDRDIISGVFYNRINSTDKTLNKLQSCATIQYILLKTEGAVKERLYEKDLAIEDPYNTYLHAGLPPGPICSPGEEAIKAALFPEETNYFYFVAKSDGSHAFSETYKQHQAAIAEFGLR